MRRYRKRHLQPDEPLLHRAHKRPITRRDFLAQGLMAGVGMAVGPTIFSLFANPGAARAALAPELETLKASCGIGVQGADKIPFICFDLAGGANIAGSNVLVGREGGQLDFLSTAGYNKLGLPGDVIPPVANPITGATDHIDQRLGLAFHADSAMLRGIFDKIGAGTAMSTNGAVIPARSENDTGNNPHNPMYGIARAGADGELLSLVGSRSSESGGNSLAPAMLVDPQKRPTKIDRPSDVSGLVDTGKLVGLLEQEDAVAVMESIANISNMKLGQVNSGVVGRDELIKDLLRCGYLKSAHLVEEYGNPADLDPEQDPLIVGNGAIFNPGEFSSEGEFRKTASVMKMVIDGYAGAGTITMGGFDYHTGERATGELRDLRAGRCIGACLEYAARKNRPVMIYVFSDGSVGSNGMIDDSQDGRGKGVWTGDNQSTAASFFLVFNPGGRPALLGATPEEQAVHQQLGYFTADGAAATSSSPAANNVNLLVETVVLNYLALHGESGQFETLFPNRGLSGNLDRLTAFQPIVSGTIT